MDQTFALRTGQVGPAQGAEAGEHGDRLLEGACGGASVPCLALSGALDEQVSCGEPHMAQIVQRERFLHGDHLDDGCGTAVAS